MPRMKEVAKRYPKHLKKKQQDEIDAMEIKMLGKDPDPEFDNFDEDEKDFLDTYDKFIGDN